jgi:hypothetical protein
MSDKIAQLPKHAPKLHAGRFSLAETVRQPYFVRPEEGTKPEALLEPQYWAHVAPKLRPLDEITAVPDGGAWYARYLVLYATTNEAKVHLLEKVALSEAAPADLASAYESKWRGPSAKFGVVNKDTKEVVKDGFETKDQADAFLAQHVKALAA